MQIWIEHSLRVRLSAMSKAVEAALFVLFLCAGTLSAGAETRPSVSDFLDQAQATYDKMQSYSSAGEVTSNVSLTDVGPVESHYTFSIKLKRPNLYQVQWDQHAPFMNTSGAVWSAGDGNFVTMPGQANPIQAKDMASALSMATGISGTAAATVPSIFFGLNFNSFKHSTAARYGQDADIEGDLCYVITEKTGVNGVTATMWISRKSKLLRQVREDFSGPVKIPEMTDEQTKNVLESMGQKPTAAATKHMKEQMSGMRAMMMSSGMSGSIIQVQRQIVVNAAFSKADFTLQAAPASK
jgi:outer membrane lipoprotein-sorting protein